MRFLLLFVSVILTISSRGVKASYYELIVAKASYIRFYSENIMKKIEIKIKRIIENKISESNIFFACVLSLLLKTELTYWFAVLISSSIIASSEQFCSELGTDFDFNSIISLILEQ